MNRSAAGVFAGKESYMTLRDLFRWGERYRRYNHNETTKLFDWDQYLVDHGYFILAGRCRRETDRSFVQSTIERQFKRSINIDHLFSTASSYLPVDLCSLLDAPNFCHMVWTLNMRRMAVLAAQCVAYDEPVLLIGDTGCGKTSLCQLLAAVRHKPLLTINCHQATEAADFVGRMRPIVDRTDSTALFEWQPGVLVRALRDGVPLLIDEISLAADSVLERINSVLEPERQLLVSDSGVCANTITAVDGFQLVATMNPGGDYGKREVGDIGMYRKVYASGVCLMIIF